MVSLKDIAEACGVSIATVSKSLNNAKDVSDKTKQRVCAKAREMGYYPNSAAIALKTNRTNNIGVLFTDEANSGLTHDYFSYVLDSFKQTAETYGYDITFINCAKDRPNRMTYLEHAKYRNFDGVVIACIDFNDPETIELMNSDIPIVTIDYVYNNRMAVTSDNIHGMSDLVAHCYGQGHRKIAFIHGNDSSVTRNRMASFFRTCDLLNLDIPDDYIREVPYRSTSGTEKATRELLDMDNPPTCILCPDDFAAFGALNVAHDRGLVVGKDISIAGYDGISIGRHIEPKLTTIRQDSKAIGRKAAERLVSLIEKPKTTLIEQVVVPAALYEGGTVGKIN